MTAHTDQPVLRWIALAAVLGVLVGGLVTAGAADARRDDVRDPQWRTDYDRGWAFLVQTQLTERPRDDLATAGCRWWVDGDGVRTAGIQRRAAFVAGCDTAAQLTNLEAP